MLCGIALPWCEAASCIRPLKTLPCFEVYECQSNTVEFARNILVKMSILYLQSILIHHCVPNVKTVGLEVHPALSMTEPKYR